MLWLVLIVGVLCYMGMLLDERTLMAAAVALCAMTVVSLIGALAQWLWGFPAGERTVTAQYERLDHHGNVVSHVIGELPDRRGLYRTHSVVVRWYSPFGLFAASKVEKAAGETLILPDDERSVPADAARAIGRRVAGLAQSEQMGSVRGYTPGDPIKLISWKHTARRGKLMTRETGRDERATLLLAVNTRGADGLDAERMDSEVAALVPFLAGMGPGMVPGAVSGAGMRVVVTDGVTFHEGESAARRFLAAVCVDGDAACAPTDTACAAGVSRFAQNQSGPVTVVICDASDSKGFEHALESTPFADRLRILTPMRQATERFAQTVLSSSAQMPSSTAQAAPRTVQTPVRIAQTFARIGRLTDKVRSMEAGPILPIAICALMLLTVFALTLKGLSGLVSPSGAWIWFAGALLAVASIEASIPWSVLRARSARDGTWRSRLRLELIRIGAYTLLTALVTAILLVVRLHDLTGEWPFSREQGIGGSWAMVKYSVLGGFNELNLQLPPLKVSILGDIFLILVVAISAIVIRCLLTVRALMPAMGLLAVTALAADYAIVGHVTPWWQIAVLVMAFAMGVWALRPRRMRPPAAIVASIVVVAITLAGGPSAETLAYDVPLSIGEGGGMFTSNTVSPMIDLKRNIAAGSDTTVLRYRSYRRMYLRMTTLDQFDGDTWGYNKDLALDAGLYGAGIQLGRNASDDLRIEQRRVNSPLAAYMQLLGYFGYDVAGVSQDTLERFMGYARVRVDTLRSRFLPMPGLTTDVDGLGSDWLKYQDGSVYNRSGSTSSDTAYTASGSYIDPIRSSSGFSELNVIDDTVAKLNSQNANEEANTQQWLQARSALPGAGLGEIRQDSVLIHATIGSDGVVRGPNDWELGRVSTYDIVWGADAGPNGQDGQSGQDGQDGDGHTVIGGAGRPSDITFNSTVIEQLGIGEDGVMLGFSDDGRSVTIAMPIKPLDIGTIWSDETSEYYSSGEDGLSQWMGETSQLLASMGLNNINGRSESGRADATNRMLRWIRDAVKESDERAHSSQYTSLPKSLPANVKAIIAQAQAAGIPIKGSGYDNQIRVMRWLVDYFTSADNHFTYSLDAPDGDGRSNMEVINDFLDPDSGHAGYCQHYASALAVLARAMGVPTRIVLGYNSGSDDEKDADGYIAVKSRQLHAWVEAYLDGVGWVPFDVTPASEQNGTLGDAASATTQQSQSTDSSDQATTDTQSDQSDANDSSSQSSSDSASSDSSQEVDDQTGEQTGTRGKASSSSAAEKSIWSRASAWFGSLPMWGRALFGTGGAVALIMLLVFAPRGVRWWRRRRCIALTRASAEQPDDAALRARAWRAAWEQLKREGRRRGVRWSPSDTDMAIAARIADAYGQRSSERRPDGSANGGTSVGVAGDAPAGVSDDTPKTVLRVSRNAAAAAFGGETEHVGRLPHDLRRLFTAPRHADGR